MTDELSERVMAWSELPTSRDNWELLWRDVLGEPHEVVLRELDVHQTRLKPCGLDALTGAAWRAQLEVLNVSGAGVTRAAFKALVGVSWPALHTLDLSWNKLSADGIKALVANGAECLPELRVLNLHATQLNGAAIEALCEQASSFPMLRELTLEGWTG